MDFASNTQGADLPHLVAAFAAAFVAGAINSVAGGGTLLTFPVLLTLGLPPVIANSTNTVGIWPGAIGSILGFRREVAALDRRLFWLMLPAFTGALLGAVALRDAPQRIFEQVVPLLILFATLLFIVQAKMKRASPEQASALPFTLGRLPLAATLQFGVAVYGGYFGAGMSIMALAVLGFLGMSDMLAMSATTSLLGVAINGAAGLVFICAGLVSWPYALAMAAGSLAGGYGAAGIARKIGKTALRYFVIVVGLSMSVVMFIRMFLNR
jgi:hypothetical protein